MEKLPKPEFSAEELQLIEKLKTDPSGAETLAALQAWYDHEAARANEKDTGRANAEFTLKRAQLYLAAGLNNQAWEELNDLREQASGEGADDLLASAEGLLDQIERGS